MINDVNISNIYADQVCQGVLQHYLPPIFSSSSLLFMSDLCKFCSLCLCVCVCEREFDFFSLDYPLCEGGKLISCAFHLSIVEEE